MNMYKTNARIVGVLLLIATLAGVIGGAIFLWPILDAPDYLTKMSTNENQVSILIGALLFFSMGVAGASISIPMYPLLKKQNEPLALGAVVFRAIEGAIWMVGVVSLLSLVILSQEFVKAGAPIDSYFQTLGELLRAGTETTGALVLGYMAFCIGALMYYYIFYQSKLVPRWLSVWGLVAITLAFVAGLVDMFGVVSGDDLTTISLLLNLPIFVQELVLGVWLIVKGFDSSAIALEA